MFAIVHIITSRNSWSMRFRGWVEVRMPLIGLVHTSGILDTLEFLIKSSKVVIITMVLFLDIE
jgi:hypothetical protein